MRDPAQRSRNPLYVDFCRCLSGVWLLKTARVGELIYKVSILVWLLLGATPSFPAGTLSSLLHSLLPPDLTVVIQGKELADFLPAFRFLRFAYSYVCFSPSWVFKQTHLQLFICQISSWGSSLVSYGWMPLHLFSS